MHKRFRQVNDGPSSEDGDALAVSRPPDKIDRLLVPDNVLQQTVVGLSLARTREALAYWVGVGVGGSDGETRAIVTTVAFPSVYSAYDHFEVVEGQMGLVTAWCAKRGLWVLGQVHTHPTDEPHSPADETWPASHRQGFFSVVIPYFAQLSTLRTLHWRAYESDGSGSWLQIVPEDRFDVIDQVWLPPQ